MTAPRKRPRIYPGDGDPRHGTYNGYKHLLCWCESCRAANADQARAQEAARPPLAPDDPRHGTLNGYNNYRCRCRPCTVANTDASRARRQCRAAARAEAST